MSAKKMLTVKITLEYENMRTLEAILSMYEDSDDRLVRRIAETARKRVTKILDPVLTGEEL